MDQFTFHPRQREPRCFGKLTSTRPRASPTWAPATWPPPPPNCTWPTDLAVTSARGYLIQGDLDRGQVERIADELLADRVVERTVVAPVGDPALTELPAGRTHWIHVLPKPGVMDPVAQSAMEAIADLGIRAEAVRTLKKYAVGRLARRQTRAALLEGPGQRRHRAGDRRPAELRAAASRLALPVPARHRADPRDGRRRPWSG